MSPMGVESSGPGGADGPAVDAEATGEHSGQQSMNNTATDTEAISLEAMTLDHVRAQTKRVFDLGLKGQLDHFTVDMTQMPKVKKKSESHSSHTVWLGISYESIAKGVSRLLLL